MKIFPAIDLIGGKAVRLRKGDYAEMTVYSDDPVSVAADFKSKGADCIHLVDLEGANLELYRELTEGFKMEIVASGGVTSIDEIKTLRDCGAGGAIIGKAYYEGLISLEDAIAAAK